MIYRQRKSIRLKEHDYSKAGFYFITVCVRDKQYRLGTIQDSSNTLTTIGKIALEHINDIPNHFPDVRIPYSVIMPNHIHMLVNILMDEQIPGSIISEAPIIQRIQQKSKELLPRMIQQYKASVSRSAHVAGLWQERYFERIIRSNVSYEKVKIYILTNPERWKNDKYYVPPREPD